MEQELLEKALMLKQHSEEVEKKLEFVNEQIAEMEKFCDGLEVLGKSGEKEILAPLGRKVYAKAEKKDEKLFVEVGAGVVVRKTPDEVKEIVQGQVKRFAEARAQLLAQLGAFREEFGKMVEEIEKIRNKK